MIKQILGIVIVAVVVISSFLMIQSKQAQAQVTATLALSPASTSVSVNNNFTVAITLNTSGSAVDGVDIYTLHFVPSVLQVVDSDAATAGVQIAAGTLMPNTAINTVDNATGTIQFSQSTSGGSNFTGSGTLATITFRGQATGTSAVTFDFTAGSTADTNVAFQGNDRLSSVTNGSYTVVAPDTTAPTVSITAPASGSNVSGNVTVSATASDNVGVSGVQFKLDGANLGAEDTASPFSITWNSSAASVGTHTLTATARDAAGNTTTSAGVSVTVPTSFDFSMSNGGAKSVTQGSNVTNTITATLSAGSTQAVTFSASGLPTGVSAGFSPTSCSPTCSTTLTLTATGSATTGTTTTTITGTAGAVTHTTTFSLTVASGSFQRTVSLDFEGRTNKAVSGTLEVLSNPTKTLLRSYPFTSNSSGGATITFDISAQTVFLKAKAAPFLSRLLSNIDLNSNVTYTFPMLLTGDINQDSIINSVDYSILNTNWFTSNASADLNQDGLVNSIDYSFMNNHWLATGEQ
jgi:hypothetical protein